jgi:hypothetical protein
MSLFFGKFHVKPFILKAHLVLCVVTLASGINAFASDFQSPRTAALGGAGHASPMLNDAIYLNPSFASWYAGPSGCDGCGSSDPHGHTLNFSLQDGRSDLFQAGVGYTQTEDRKTINIGASHSVIEKLGVGLGGKWVLPNLNAPHPIWDSIFSVTGVALDWFQVAFVVDNIIQSDIEKSYGLYREYILGTKFNAAGIVLIYFDPHLAPDVADGNTFGHELGLEFPMMQDFFLRIGNFRNANVPDLSIRGNGYSIGAGWIGPRISFDFALQRMITPISSNVYHFGTTVYF